MILGRIHCAVSKTTLNAILASFGLMAVPRSQPSDFDVISMTRHSDPVVERDLFDLALHKLVVAHGDGALPSWTLVEKRKPEAS